MEKGIRMSYETIGASSYMVAFCAPEVELIHFKLEMLLANDIKNIMKITRQMIDGETVIYYNITSKIPLRQVLDRRKLSRQEFLGLIGGGIEAIRDAADFGLAESGFVLEPDYIYVNPASCAPSFMYLPMQGQAGMTLKELISDLILHDRIELTNDNFIQVLLKELNRQPFSMEQLEKILRQYQSGSQSAERNAKSGRISTPAIEKPVFHESQMPGKSMNSGISENGSSGMNERNRQQAPEIPNRQPEERKEEKAPEPPKGKFPSLPKGGDSKKGKEKPAKKEKKKEVSTPEEEETGEEAGFDAEKARKKFLLPQALIMVLLAAGISFGFFLDEAGKIVINNVLAVLIVVGMAEIILYREAYVNSKAPKKTKGKKTAPSQKNTKKSTPRAENSVRKPVPPVNQPELEYARQSLPSAVQPKSQYEAYGAAGSGRSGYGNFASAADSGYGNADDTELNEDGGNGIGMAYLEYFENGRISRISLDQENGVTVGRLSTEVDFAVRNPRVGKIHARFYGRDGRFYVVDINSKNGTYINGNGMRIESNVPYLLHDKDRVMLADCEFTIRCPEY